MSDRNIPTDLVPAWRSLETAPRDGTEILGLYDGNEVPIQWAEERQCMLAGIGGGNGYFGPGWQDTENRLIADVPEAWRPLTARESGT